MHKPLIITALLFTLFTLFTHAAKMQPGIVSVRQADGTMLNVKAYGDEDMSYFTTVDGVLLVLDGANYYVARVDEYGMLSSSGILAHDKGMRSATETEQIEKQDKALFAATLPKLARQAKAMRETITANTTLLPHKGSPKIPIILVEFSDSLFHIENTKDVFNKYLNSTELFDQEKDAEMGRNYGSVKRYFTDMSHGMFTPQFDVYGPVNLGKPLASYGKGTSSQENMNGLLIDACAAVDSVADFSQYDANNDNLIDLVYILYAGYSAAMAGNTSDCIHPKSGTINSFTAFDGKKICRYSVSNELNGAPMHQSDGWLINGIGVFCHELSHGMGLPDLYPTPGSQAERTINQNLDYWSLMDAGEYTYNGYRPTEYTAWERECFGWTTIDTLTHGMDITMTPLARGGKAYRIVNDQSEDGCEYYILENIQNEGWNKYVKGHGMTIMHVDYSPSYFSLGGCKVNSTYGHPRMTLIPADGTFVSEYFIGEQINADNKIIKGNAANQDILNRYDGQTITSAIYNAEQAGDPYPGSTGKTALTDETSPAAWVYAGEFMGKPISEIVEDTEQKTISFKFMGGNQSYGIRDISTTNTDKRIYTLDGRYTGTSVQYLPKGIYIIGGNKVIIQ